jgi:hypothetical protein
MHLTDSMVDTFGKNATLDSFGITEYMYHRVEDVYSDFHHSGVSLEHIVRFGFYSMIDFHDTLAKCIIYNYYKSCEEDTLQDFFDFMEQLYPRSKSFCKSYSLLDFLLQFTTEELMRITW